MMDRDKLGRFIKGEHYSPKTEFKKGCISLNKGKVCSEKTRKKISESCKGRIPWNKEEKFKKFCLNCTKQFFVIHSRNDIAKYCSQKCHYTFRTGKPNPKQSETLTRLYKENKIISWNKGLTLGKYSEEHCSKISEGLKKAYRTRKRIPHMLGKHHSEETRFKMSQSNLIRWQIRKEAEGFMGFPAYVRPKVWTYAK